MAQGIAEYDDLCIGGDWVASQATRRIGRELGPEGIAPYTEYQSIILPPRA